MKRSPPKPSRAGSHHWHAETFTHSGMQRTYLTSKLPCGRESALCTSGMLQGYLSQVNYVLRLCSLTILLQYRYICFFIYSNCSVHLFQIFIVKPFYKASCEGYDFFITSETSFPSSSGLGQTHCCHSACFVVQITPFHFFCAHMASAVRSLVARCEDQTAPVFLIFLLNIVLST